jgi:hypothetical protein
MIRFKASALALFNQTITGPSQVVNIARLGLLSISFPVLLPLPSGGDKDCQTG